MTLDSYRKADCPLFRVPPIDFSTVQEALELTIVRAWESGQNAQNTINSLLQNSQVVGTLAVQVESHLGYQRASALGLVETEKASKLAMYDQKKKEETTRVEEAYAPELREREERTRTLEGNLSRKHATYTAAQARLEEMRGRVRAKLDTLGGKKGFQTLLTLQQAITQHPSSSYEDIGYESAHPHLAQALNLVTSFETIDPLQGQTLETLVSNPPPPSKKSLPYRALQKIWAFLNYKMW
mgnify:CR=1 FL=1